MDKLFNWISVVFGVIGGTMASLCGGFDKWLGALLLFVVLDYMTGIAKAINTKTLSSEIGFRGICKKVLIFIVVIIAVTLQGLLNNSLPLRDIVVCFYLSFDLADLSIARLLLL